MVGDVITTAVDLAEEDLEAHDMAAFPLADLHMVVGAVSEATVKVLKHLI